MEDPALDYTRYPNYINKAIPFFLASLILEISICIYKNKKLYRFNDSVNSISLGLLQEIVNVFVKPINYIPYLYIWNNYAIVQLGADSWVTWWVAFIAIDFGYYWFHRWGHVYNFGWATHVPHHSSDDYNLSTALRQGAFQYLFGWIFYLPLAFVCHPLIYSFHTYFNRLFQFWVHTQLIGKMGILEYILVTPSHHRVHHGSNPEYLDKNYGATLIIWDKMFGTFAEERNTVKYGITTGLGSWSPLWGNFHYFVYMYELSKELTGLDKLQVLWRGPGWTPRRQRPASNFKKPYVKYDQGSDLPKQVWGYILLQMTATVALRKLLEAFFPLFSRFSLFVLYASIVLFLVSVGAMLMKTISVKQEQGRIVVTCLALLLVAWQAHAPVLATIGGVIGWAALSLFVLPMCNLRPE